MTIPKNAKKIRKRFFKVPLSAIAPQIGAKSATKIEASELPNPK